ncbi:MAG: efflux RND transporter periplasmic adaptor subunit [Candidatus Sumerlaeota bacterium]|nr:efflux RND transporter periplasmic adaptor subunit [Candidatus Sumerlaeota bacterium]
MWVFAAALILSGCERKEESKPAAVAPPEVLVTEAQSKNVPATREWVSTLDGSINVNVQARVQGYIQKQVYNNGTVVKVGDALFEIDPRPFEAALEQAKANLANAQAQQVEANLTEQRQVQLFASNAISAAERDKAVQANAAAKASVLAMQAAVDQAQLNLGYTKITAPVEGIAGINKPGIGDLVGPATGELCKISTVDPIKAIFQLSEQEYLRAAEAWATENEREREKVLSNVELELILASGKAYEHRGKLSVLDRQVDPRTGTIRIEGLFPNPGRVLRPGFFARVRIMIQAKGPSLIIPQRAVMEVQSACQVAVVGADNKISIRNVEVGDRIGSDWVIKDGLKPGERVVAEGVQMVRDGMTVNPKPFVGKSDADAASDAKTTETKSEAR